MGSKNTPSTSIKQETPDDEIKEYAETAMNELLGWYGYEKVDSRDTQGLNLHHFAGPTSPTTPTNTHHSDSSSDVTSPTASPPPVVVPAGFLACAWCRKVGQAKQFTFKTSTPQGSKAFCSEVCFTQCRRASFKRNKTCDWCRHVRHTVNYVDFQDGDHQLQFCSDKCLNQYKMNIFCKETQAHLQLHPQLKEAGGASGSPGVTASTSLITPDLWMRDCRSESPDSTRSQSPDRLPSPIIEITTSAARKPPPSPCSEDDIKPTNLTISPKSPPPPPPVVAALKSKKDGKPRKIVRTKKTTRICAQTVTPQVEINLNTNSSSPRSTNSGSPPKNPIPPMIPPLPNFPLPPNHLFPPDHPLHRPPFLNPGFFPPPHMFAEFAARFPFPRPPVPNMPPLLPINRHIHLHPPPPPPQHPPPPPSLLPPPTLMVPYPVPIPIPIPMIIPIPIPPNFKLKEEKDKVQNETSSNNLEMPNIKVEVESPPPQNTTLNLSLAQSSKKRKRSELTADEEVSIKQNSIPA